MSLRRLTGFLCVLGLSLFAFAADAPDKDVANRLTGSIFTGPSMKNLRDLTDSYGGRLTGSPAYQRAADWAVARFPAMASRMCMWSRSRCPTVGREVGLTLKWSLRTLVA